MFLFACFYLWLYLLFWKILFFHQTHLSKYNKINNVWQSVQLSNNSSPKTRGHEQIIGFGRHKSTRHGDLIKYCGNYTIDRRRQHLPRCDEHIVASARDKLSLATCVSTVAFFPSLKKQESRTEYTHIYPWLASRHARTR